MTEMFLIYLSTGNNGHYVGYECGSNVTLSNDCTDYNTVNVTAASDLGDTCETGAGCPSSGIFNITRCYCNKDLCNPAMHLKPNISGLIFSVLSAIYFFKWA